MPAAWSARESRWRSWPTATTPVAATIATAPLSASASLPAPIPVAATVPDPGGVSPEPGNQFAETVRNRLGGDEHHAGEGVGGAREPTIGAKRAAGAAQKRLHRRLAGVHHLGDLARRQSAPMTQNERVSLRFGEVVQRGSDRGDLLVHGRTRRDIGGGGLRRYLVGGDVVTIARQVQRAPTHGGHKPRARVVEPVSAFKHAEGLQKCDLHQILGVRHALGQESRVAVQRSGVLVVQLGQLLAGSWESELGA